MMLQFSIEFNGSSKHFLQEVMRWCVEGKGKDNSFKKVSVWGARVGGIQTTLKRNSLRLR